MIIKTSKYGSDNNVIYSIKLGLSCNVFICQLKNDTQTAVRLHNKAVSCGVSHYHVECCLGLALNVPGPSYLGLTRSISWLLMPWLLTSPGHQQP